MTWLGAASAARPGRALSGAHDQNSSPWAGLPSDAMQRGSSWAGSLPHVETAFDPPAGGQVRGRGRERGERLRGRVEPRVVGDHRSLGAERRERGAGGRDDDREARAVIVAVHRPQVGEGDRPAGGGVDACRRGRARARTGPSASRRSCARRLQKTATAASWPCAPEAHVLDGGHRRTSAFIVQAERARSRRQIRLEPRCQLQGEPY